MFARGEQLPSPALQQASVWELLHTLLLGVADASGACWGAASRLTD